MNWFRKNKSVKKNKFLNDEHKTLAKKSKKMLRHDLLMSVLIIGLLALLIYTNFEIWIKFVSGCTIFFIMALKESNAIKFYENIPMLEKFKELKDKEIEKQNSAKYINS
ncbi:MAG: hypothetical protein PF569_01960 [Candidatus Woesearchaeota archaeon]|jgi:hypothetical protein|nr:hypothetical protein [Candidatus Woesearchaeota archaeon]